MNCLQPQCPYAATKNKPGLLKQHMIRSHDIQDMQYYKGGATTTMTTTAGNMFTSDIGMAEDNFDKERICDVLRDSVLNLCKENYSCAVEVDGLICISVVNSTEQHVVKIHDLLMENGQTLSMKNTSSKSKSNQNKQDLESIQSENQPHPMLVVKNKSSRTNNQNPRKATTTSKRKNQNIAVTPVSQVTTANSSRFPFLVQTLQEGRKFPNNRASSASPTVQLQDQTPQTRSSLLGNMGSNTVMDKDRPASNLLKILSTQKQQLAKENDNIGQSTQNENAEQSKQNDNNEELILSVKKEPVDDEMADEYGSITENDSNSQEQSQEVSSMLRVKNEPTWNESEYGGTSSVSNSGQIEQSDAESSQGTLMENTVESISNQTASASKNKKSILANILNGKEESYTKSRDTLASLAARTSSDLANFNQGAEKSDEQDNSLLYRLPFVTFQDLFPGGPSGETSEVTFNESPANIKKPTKSEKSVNLEVIMRRMLEDKSHDKKKKSPRKRKKVTTSYEEMEDFVVSDDYSEEDFNSPVSDKDDDVYVPESKEMTEDIEEEFTMSLRKKTKARKKAKKRSVALKSTTKVPQQTVGIGNDNNMEVNNDNNTIQEVTDPSLFRYACSHCELRFKDRLERDKHEEESCLRELIICDICKGYFANTSSRNKHLWEVHTILSDEQKEEIKENRQGALDEFKTVIQPQLEQSYEFDNQMEEGGTEFDLDASSVETTLVTKFIVPFSKENADSFIKCPLCINLFSDLASKDEHLKKKHKIANQIDNGNGTISLQVLESKPSNVPPVFVKFETT